MPETLKRGAEEETRLARKSAVMPKFGWISWGPSSGKRSRNWATAPKGSLPWVSYRIPDSNAMNRSLGAAASTCRAPAPYRPIGVNRTSPSRTRRQAAEAIPARRFRRTRVIAPKAITPKANMTRATTWGNAQPRKGVSAVLNVSDLSRGVPGGSKEPATVSRVRATIPANKPKPRTNKTADFAL